MLELNGIKLNIGYTPENLNALLGAYKITRASAYRHLGKARSNFDRYLLPVDDAQHISMNHKDWLKFMELVDQVKIKRLEELTEKKRKREARRLKQAAHMMQVNELRKQGKAGTLKDLREKMSKH